MLRWPPLFGRVGCIDYQLVVRIWSTFAACAGRAVTSTRMTAVPSTEAESPYGKVIVTV